MSEASTNFIIIGGDFFHRSIGDDLVKKFAHVVGARDEKLPVGAVDDSAVVELVLRAAELDDLVLTAGREIYAVAHDCTSHTAK